MNNASVDIFVGEDEMDILRSLEGTVYFRNSQDGIPQDIIECLKQIPAATKYIEQLNLLPLELTNLKSLLSYLNSLDNESRFMFQCYERNIIRNTSNRSGVIRTTKSGWRVPYVASHSTWKKRYYNSYDILAIEERFVGIGYRPAPKNVIPNRCSNLEVECVLLNNIPFTQMFIESKSVRAKLAQKVHTTRERDKREGHHTDDLLSATDAWELLKNAHRLCPGCGCALLYANYTKYCQYQYSLDRLDWAKPHSIGNVRILCLGCNLDSVDGRFKDCPNGCHPHQDKNKVYKFLSHAQYRTHILATLDSCPCTFILDNDPLWDEIGL